MKDIISDKKSPVPSEDALEKVTGGLHDMLTNDPGINAVMPIIFSEISGNDGNTGAIRKNIDNGCSQK